MTPVVRASSLVGAVYRCRRREGYWQCVPRPSERVGKLGHDPDPAHTERQFSLLSAVAQVSLTSQRDPLPRSTCLARWSSLLLENMALDSSDGFTTELEIFLWSAMGLLRRNCEASGSNRVLVGSGRW